VTIALQTVMPARKKANGQKLSFSGAFAFELRDDKIVKIIDQT